MAEGLSRGRSRRRRLAHTVLVGTLAAAAVACGGPTEDAGAGAASDAASSGVAESSGATESPDVALVEVGVGPCCLAATDDEILVMNLRDHSIQQVDPRTNQADDPVSVFPFDEMIGAGDSLLLAAPSRSEVALFDPQTSEVGASILVEGEFRGMAFDAESNTLWVGSATDGTLTHIDAATGRVLDTFTVDGLPSGGVMVSTGKDELWVATFDADISKVDLAQRSVVTSLKPFGPEPVEVSLVSAGGHLWATSPQKPTLLRIDSRTGKIDRRGSIDASGDSFPRLSAAPDGTLWVAVAPDRIEELDAGSGQTLKSYDIPLAGDADPNDYYNVGGIITGFGSAWTTIFNDNSFVDDAVVRIRR